MFQNSSPGVSISQQALSDRMPFEANYVEIFKLNACVPRFFVIFSELEDTRCTPEIAAIVREIVCTRERDS